MKIYMFNYYPNIKIIIRNTLFPKKHTKLLYFILINKKTKNNL